VKLEQSFEIEAPIDAVWTALLDLEQVAPCLPGATITGHDEDGTYHGTFRVKLGPTTANYNGTIRIESSDPQTHTATLAARGTDKRGQGGASATVVNTLHQQGEATRIDAVTDFTITGRLASFGRGGIVKDISNRLLREFAACLQQRLAGQPAGGLTADEAAASAGAAELVAEGKSPAEVSAAGTADGAGDVAAAPGDAAAAPSEAAGKSPAEVAGRPAGEEADAAPPGEAAGKSPAEVGGPPTPQAQAEPLDAGNLLVSVARDRLAALWEAIGALWQRLGRWLRARSR
jgi:carbon monoxide dehydrogenase subunit G